MNPIKPCTSLYLLLITLLFTACNNSKTSPNTSDSIKQQSVSISYHLKTGDDHCSNQLIATIDDKEHVIIDFDEHRFLYIQLQGDFNNDGATDVLLEHRHGCHTSAPGTSYVSSEGSSYFIMTYDGTRFRSTKEIGIAWNGIEMKMKDKTLHFSIATSLNPSYSTKKELSCTDKEADYVLDGYDLRQTSITENKKIEAIKEVSSTALINKTSVVNSEKYLGFDINSDGTKDLLTMTYNKTVNGFSELKIRLTNKINIETIETFKRSVNRVGILESKTNGMHDLVIDCNSLFKWNGKTYSPVHKILETKKYKVFAKNGLIIRDRPEGNPIGKFDYGDVIEIIEKTAIEMDYEEEAYVTIEGYWYKTSFFDKTSNIKQQGYVFSGYLANLDKCTLFSTWDEMSISNKGITYSLHAQCYYVYPVKIINENEVELIWSQDMDCVFDSGLADTYDSIKNPENGKPFAKFTLHGDTLKATYYYPEWVQKYNENYPAIFKETFSLNYPSLIDY
ncbi:SH3 domain-containing protein [Olleya sp. Bg11-27]|uniref:SH3 domain-containing protein n=1 Tax=Olleya sp. Bg11-27 TaxID=2058135 RepID=UPI000C30832C|nr:SH3 domain-containing protein [Olleya sp. Bg11-27]AUC76280.1 hypothetical protein CW732_11630 [Olleya sp. Bg11-27]